MYIYPFRNNIKNITIILFILGFASFLFAEETNSRIADNRGYITSRETPEIKKGTVVFKENAPRSSLEKEENLSVLQKQARLYRSQGLEFQSIGNLEAAVSLYQKAIELDPAYAVVYNDLGIIYEANGWIERAEQSYFQAIKIDPNYLSAYSNLALLYENKRDLKKCVFYWKKRVELGLSDDPWTQKAKKRLEDIRLALGEKDLGSSKEQAVIDLMKDVAIKKSVSKPDNKTLAKMHFEKAKLSDKKGDKLVAYKEATEALQLDPSSREIEKFVDKLQTELLTK